MCKNGEGKVLWKWIEDRYTVTEFLQRKPYTCVGIVVFPLERTRSETIRGVGFSKFNPNDSKFDWQSGKDLALKRAKQDALLQLLKRKEYSSLKEAILSGQLHERI